MIRDVPEALVLALEERAAANGRSAEAEHRLILAEALRSGRNEFRKRAGHVVVSQLDWLPSALNSMLAL